jgi:hypothetical protein
MIESKNILFPSNLAIISMLAIEDAMGWHKPVLCAHRPTHS